MTREDAEREQRTAAPETPAPDSGGAAPAGETARRQPLFKRLEDYYLRLTISRKMLLGYASLVGLLVLISVFALLSLNRLNRINQSILLVDVPVIDAADKMIDIVLAQELYARRFLILGTPEMLKIFWERSAEFDQLVESLGRLPEARHFPTRRIDALHREYNDMLMNGLELLKEPESPEAHDFENRIRLKQEALIGLIKEMSATALRDQNRKTGETARIGLVAYRTAGILCLVGFVISVIAALLITRNISGSVRELRTATLHISEGRFDYRPRIRNRDELGELARDFSSMALRLKRLEETFLDASPLTRLPGGISVGTVLEKRIADRTPFAFCLIDIDHFKAYNDRYGYGRGNELIRHTAGLIEEAVKQRGGKDDFVGHIGGDDFAVITDYGLFGDICGELIRRFDETVADFYDPADREAGYFVGKNRQGEEIRFPLATLSIAVVTNRRGRLENHIQVGEIAAELKEYAKSIPGSNYVVDQRRRGEDRRSSPGGPKIVEFPGKKEDTA